MGEKSHLVGEKIATVEKRSTRRGLDWILNIASNPSRAFFFFFSLCGF